MAITNAFKEAAYLQETDDVFLVLLTITHNDITPLRVVNNNENITSDGNLFVAYPFEITLPDSTGDGTPSAQLVIDNVSREIAESLRTITTAPKVTISVIRAAVPDTIEVTFAPFTLRNVKWNVMKVSGDLSMEEIALEPFPVGQFSPAHFQGLFTV